MTEVTTFRSNHLIDPHLEIWEWQIPAYLFLGGLVAGLMILNGLWRLQGRENEGRAITFFGAIAAPIAMSIGMFFLWLDLANKLNVHQFYMTFEITSPMSWGSWLLLAVYPLMILLLALKDGIETFSGPMAIVNPIWDFVKKIARKYPKQIALPGLRPLTVSRSSCLTHHLQSVQLRFRHWHYVRLDPMPLHPLSNWLR